MMGCLLKLVDDKTLVEACEEHPLCVASVLPHILDCQAHSPGLHCAIGQEITIWMTGATKHKVPYAAETECDMLGEIWQHCLTHQLSLSLSIPLVPPYVQQCRPSCLRRWSFLSMLTPNAKFVL
ncbi:hypothetical protein J6590_082792 [Homalodisca vitripennis]|nr:hypothetical protein J6590_082792 [Homalodisca vitripennis]